MVSSYIKGKVLVAIDAANLESSVKDLGWWVDYVKLRELFDSDNLHDIRFYCVHHNTENQNKFFVFLKHHSYTLVTNVLLSGDSDFNYLLRYLKRRGKTTIVVSAKHHIA